MAALPERARNRTRPANPLCGIACKTRLFFDRPEKKTGTDVSRGVHPAWAVTQKRAQDEEEDPRLNVMIGELVEWFGDEYGRIYGGIRVRPSWRVIPSAGTLVALLSSSGPMKK